MSMEFFDLRRCIESGDMEVDADGGVARIGIMVQPDPEKRPKMLSSGQAFVCKSREEIEAYEHELRRVLAKHGVSL